ncbi:LytR/AlgR family response regulator transcription factor [Flavobacterium urocaniciphilum]|uniref:Two component transcriptional regulator, LytTR family n=1 Tax=Flavobacterium urocaniciphilum TaxID=1299341 RepID=A0A1H8ZPP2_9FLAO|nr:LytTR family DNA-binding domain-containing protein [Flavobacterium urocaniciphilum]SEP66251.1 two component transcriptional regulator, LytTR family [Flavobacterium urocaniciphilum]
MTKYDAILVDDEENNIVILDFFIKKFCPSINIVKTCINLEETILAINKYKPSIAFLDIQINENQIFEVLDKIDISEIEIIFVTAYDEFALKAFKYNAIDYVLKPISIEDLILATNKAIQRIEEKKIFENEIFKRNKLKSKDLFLTVHSLDKIDIINFEEIIFCKSDGRYTIFFLRNNEQIMACKNIGEYEELLTFNNFYRIHHSYIVNISYILKINKKAGYYCEMKNGAMIPISRRKQDGINKLLNIK